MRKRENEWKKKKITDTKEKWLKLKIEKIMQTKKRDSRLMKEVGRDFWVKFKTTHIQLNHNN